MEFLPTGVHFDKTKPYYGLVLGYLTQTHGFLDLVSRALRTEYLKACRTDRVRSEDNINQFCSFIDREKLRERARRIISTDESPLIGDHSLFGKFEDSFSYDVADLSKEAFDNYNHTLKHFNEATLSSLIILSWDVSKAYRNHDPIWEFLRVSGVRVNF